MTWWFRLPVAQMYCFPNTKLHLWSLMHTCERSPHQLRVHPKMTKEASTNHLDRLSPTDPHCYGPSNKVEQQISHTCERLAWQHQRHRQSPQPQPPNWCRLLYRRQAARIHCVPSTSIPFDVIPHSCGHCPRRYPELASSRMPSHKSAATTAMESFVSRTQYPFTGYHSQRVAKTNSRHNVQVRCVDCVGRCRRNSIVEKEAPDEVRFQSFWQRPTAAAPKPG
jgi:hypothetical protein